MVRLLIHIYTRLLWDSADKIIVKDAAMTINMWFLPIHVIIQYGGVLVEQAFRCIRSNERTDACYPIQSTLHIN